MAFSGTCFHCGGSGWGGREPSLCKPCGSFLHKKVECRRGHRCDPRTPAASFKPNWKAPTQAISSTDYPAFSSYRQPAALLGDIDSDKESLNSPITPPTKPRRTLPTCSSPPPSPNNVLPLQPTVLANLLLHLQATTPEAPPATLLAIPSPSPPPPAPLRSRVQKKQPGPPTTALTPRSGFGPSDWPIRTDFVGENFRQRVFFIW